MRLPSALFFWSAAALLLSMEPSRALALEETIVLAERARLAVMASDVTVDGKPRPDIAQALADSLTAGLLKQGEFRVFQIDPPAAKPRGKGKKGDVVLGSTTAAGSGLPGGLDFVVSFNVVSQDEEHRMTVKKVRSSDNEVVEVHEINTRGKLDKVFGMVPTVLMRLQAKVKTKAAPASLVSQPPAWMRPAVPAAASGNSSYWTHGPAASSIDYSKIDFSKVPKALIYQRLGSIQAINEAWKFCIIRPSEAAKLRLRDSLHVLYDEDGTIYADLTVANFDSGAVIADFGNRTPLHHKLFPGDEVFGWAPPLH